MPRLFKVKTFPHVVISDQLGKKIIYEGSGSLTKSTLVTYKEGKRPVPVQRVSYSAATTRSYSAAQSYSGYSAASSFSGYSLGFRGGGRACAS